MTNVGPRSGSSGTSAASNVCRARRVPPEPGQSRLAGGSSPKTQGKSTSTAGLAKSPDQVTTQTSTTHHAPTPRRAGSRNAAPRVTSGRGKVTKPAWCPAGAHEDASMTRPGWSGDPWPLGRLPRLRRDPSSEELLDFVPLSSPLGQFGRRHQRVPASASLTDHTPCSHLPNRRPHDGFPHHDPQAQGGRCPRQNPVSGRSSSKWPTPGIGTY